MMLNTNIKVIMAMIIAFTMLQMTWAESGKNYEIYTTEKVNFLSLEEKIEKK